MTECEPRRVARFTDIPTKDSMVNRSREISGEAESERGKSAGFNGHTGEATGSGSGAGDPGETREDYDSDLRGNAPAER